jgi:hypothetical protein
MVMSTHITVLKPKVLQVCLDRVLDRGDLLGNHVQHFDGNPVEFIETSPGST